MHWCQCLSCVDGILFVGELVAHAIVQIVVAFCPFDPLWLEFHVGPHDVCNGVHHVVFALWCGQLLHSLPELVVPSVDGL